MSRPLQIKHRPEYLEDIFGNKETVEMVSNILGREINTIPHSWLITGPAGCGKTTIARIITEELGCSELDFHEYNSSDSRGIDFVRELQYTSKLAPSNGDVKVYLMDEVHQITSAAQEAMLKLLEDAPDNVFFLLATTNPEKLKKSLKSRCTIAQMNPVNSKDMDKLLDSIAIKEKDDLTADLKRTIISCSDGSPRVALKLFDSILEIEDEEVAIKAIQNSTVAETSIIELCRAILKGESWKEVAGVLKGLDEDPESIRRAVLGYFTKVLLNTGDLNTARILECFEGNFYDSGKAGLCLACFEASLND